MERVCFLLRVRVDRLDEYKARHRAVWPDMLEALSAAGWTNSRSSSKIWFVLYGQREMAVTFDDGEFTKGSWWTPRQLDELDPALRNPHHARFLSKVAA